MNAIVANRQCVCIVSTVPEVLAAFMAPHIRALSEKHPVMLVTSGSPERLRGLLGPRVAFFSVNIGRNVSIVDDIRALVTLWRLFRTQRCAVVHSISPKAGLLAMVAARAAGVPIRIHWFVGQVWVTRGGVARWFLKSLDKLLARSSTHLLADSHSQCAFLENEGVACPGAITVLGDGSVCGVDTSRFRPHPESRAQVRSALGIADDAVVALFVGRLNRDKGIREMTEAFAVVADELPVVHLLLVGTDEGSFRPWIGDTLGDRVTFVDYTDEVEKFMAAADLFLLPSHREGFGVTVIEAAACELPSIATRIYGLIDAVVDGETGVLVSVQDVSAIAAALRRLATDHAERRRLGHQARSRVEKKFSQDRLVVALQAFYSSL